MNGAPSSSGHVLFLPQPDLGGDATMRPKLSPKEPPTLNPQTPNPFSIVQYYMTIILTIVIAAITIFTIKIYTSWSKVMDPRTEESLWKCFQAPATTCGVLAPRV